MNEESLSRISTDLLNLIKAEEEMISQMLRFYSPQDCYYQLISRVNQRANVIAKENGFDNVLALVSEIEKHTSKKYIQFSDFGRFAIRYQTRLA
jgi:hypothetical protein